MKITKKRLSIISILLLIVIITSITVFIIHSKRQAGNETAAIKLYQDLIDTMEKNFSEDDKYISIEFGRLLDPLNKKTLSDSAKNEIINYCKKYNNTVYTKNTEELIESGLGEEGNLYGTVIKLDLTTISYNKTTISVSYYKASLGAGGTTYTCKYKNNKWEIYGSTNMWMS